MGIQYLAIYLAIPTVINPPHQRAGRFIRIDPALLLKPVGGQVLPDHHVRWTS